MFTNLKPLFLPVLVGILVSVLAFFIWMHANGPQSGSWFGQVSSITSEEIVIIDREGALSTFVLTDGVKIHKRRTELTVDDVSVDSFVHLQGQSDVTGVTLVHTIHLVNPPR